MIVQRALLLAILFLLCGYIKGESFLDKVHEKLLENIGPLKSALIPSVFADEIFFNVLSYYAPLDAESVRCRNDSIKYVEAAMKNELWALKMFDASSKVDPGAFDGNIQSFGSFDSCIKINTKHNFMGKMCVVEIVGIQALDIVKDQRGHLPYNIMFSICVPSTCSSSDVQTHMDVVLDQLNATAVVNERSCSTRDAEPFQVKDYFAVCVICGLFGLVFLTTVYDFIYFRNEKDKSSGSLSCFSLYRNLPKLSTTINPKELTTLHGLRFMAILWILMGHRYISELRIPLFTAAAHDHHVQQWYMLPLVTFQLGVEIFFLISGLVLTFNFLNSRKNNEKFNLFKFYVHRYIRITPIFAVMVLVQGVLLYHMADGPIWKKTIGMERDMCSENWWLGFLYINNYAFYKGGLDKMCFAQSWYLSADMQLYILSPLILIPLHKKPKLGLSLIFGCFFATISAAFINANRYGLYAGTVLQLNFDVNRIFDLEYSKTHLRASSYFIGMILGYVIYKHKEGSLKMNLSRISVFFGWLMSMVFIFGTFYTLFMYQQLNSHSSQFIDSLHIALNRAAFSLGVSWIIFSGVTGHGGFVSKFLSLPIFKPLATLTYCIYMIHLTFIMFEVNQTRVLNNVTLFSVIVHGLGDMTATIFLSAILFLVVESPFMELDRWIFSKNQNGNKEEEKDVPEQLTNNTRF